MNKGISLDWLRFTLPYGSLDNGSEAPVWVGGKTQECRPILSYNMGVKNELHSVYWHADHPEFRVLVEMTGQDLSRARIEGSTDEGLIRQAHRESANFTRIDVAVDLFDTGAHPTDIELCFETDQLMTVAKTVGIREEKTRTESNGRTVYIGARTSERLVRVYEKGKKSKTNLDWVRVEMEIKGKRANQLANIIQREGFDAAGKSFLRDIIEWSDIPWLEGIWGEDYDHIDIDSIGRPETDRERWLRTVVIPVISAELKEGNTWLRDAIIAAMEDCCGDGHGPNLRIKK